MPDDPYTLDGECKRYGLPTTDDRPMWVAFDTLMRHLYANHELTVHVLTDNVDLLRERLERARKALEEIAADCDQWEGEVGVFPPHLATVASDALEATRPHRE